MSTEAAAAVTDATAPQSINSTDEVHDDIMPDAVKEPADDTAGDDESNQRNNHVDQPDAHIKAKGAPQAGDPAPAPWRTAAFPGCLLSARFWRLAPG